MCFEIYNKYNKDMNDIEIEKLLIFLNKIWKGKSKREVNSIKGKYHNEIRVLRTKYRNKIMNNPVNCLINNL